MKIRWLVLGLSFVALMVSASMITGARLLEPSGGPWVRLVSFTPYAVALYTSALLLLLVALVAGRGTWRRTSGWLCVLVAPLLALHLSWLSGLYVGAGEAVADQDAMFTVMSVNLSYGDADPTRVVEEAVEHDADVIVLTEITAPALSAMRRAGLSEAFPHAAGKVGGSVEGTMVFSTHRLSGVTALDTRFAGYSMTVRLPSARFDLLAVHPPPPLGDATEWRADHATIRRAAGASRGPTVVAGDLNATLDHQPMRELGGRGFQDAAEQANSGWQPTWPASGEVSMFGIAVPPMLAIDHILVDDQLSVVDTEAVTVPGTDHRALFATMVLR